MYNYLEKNEGPFVSCVQLSSLDLSQLVYTRSHISPHSLANFGLCSPHTTTFVGVFVSMYGCITCIYTCFYACYVCIRVDMSDRPKRIPSFLIAELHQSWSSKTSRGAKSTILHVEKTENVGCNQHNLANKQCIPRDAMPTM